MTEIRMAKASAATPIPSFRGRVNSDFEVRISDFPV